MADAGPGYVHRLPSGRCQATFVGPDLDRQKAPVTFEVEDSAIDWLAGEKRLDEALANGARWVSPTEVKEKAA